MPAYEILDTYEAALLNEAKPRQEEISEIQDRSKGGLLCYACPSEAKFITRACNNHAALVKAAQACLSLLNDPNAGEPEANKLIKKLNATLAKVKAES